VLRGRDSNNRKKFEKKKDILKYKTEELETKKKKNSDLISEVTMVQFFTCFNIDLWLIINK
jgi:hypothetical protein